MSLADFEEYNWTVGKGWLSMTDPDGAGFSTGVYRHPLGLVDVDRGYGWTALGVIRDGRSIRRRWRREFGRKTISRLCREFLEEVHP